METINQKEYLKKYLSRGKELGKKKKKKKKCTGISDRVRIIDDDLDAETFNRAVEEDLQTNEDAPQIVGVIDDRPMALRIDDFRKSDKWKPLGATEAYDLVAEQVSRSNVLARTKKNANGDDYDPSRIKSEGGESISEYEQKISDDISPPRRRRRDSDASPPRKQKYNEVISLNHRSRRDDASPPKKTKRNDDFSPPRRRRSSDASHVHKSGDFNNRRGRTSSPRSNFHATRRDKRGGDYDHSPGRKRSNTETNRQTKDEVHRRSKELVDKDDAKSTKRPRSRWAQIDDDSVPPTHDIPLQDIKIEPEILEARATKTLDGKTAGLQNAEDLVRETRVFKNREDELFKNMSAEMSGVNAKTVLRDRKTGKVRDLQKEATEAKKKKEKENENKEKYDRWGKGLKQVEAYDEKLKQDLHEMSKPLARYADDVDLERHLKEQEREGDPMLAYIRKKKKVKEIVSGKPIKPQYEGEFMPNRYGIVPGHRWDGVDRSNEYEKKFFEVINSRKAQQEDVYKWSTEDM